MLQKFSRTEQPSVSVTQGLLIVHCVTHGATLFLIKQVVAWEYRLYYPVRAPLHPKVN